MIKNIKITPTFMIIMSVMTICMVGCGKDTKEVKQESWTAVAEEDNTDKDFEEEMPEISVQTSTEENMETSAEESVKVSDEISSESIEEQGERYRYDVTRYYETDTLKILNWHINIYDEEVLIQEISFERDELANGQTPLEGSIWEEDVNFDGVKDLLICQGHYGAQGGLGFRCYLANATGDGFEYCHGFEEITNPSVDSYKKLITGTVRSNAASYYQNFYEFNGQNFTLIRTELFEWDEESEQYQKVFSSDT